MVAFAFQRAAKKGIMIAKQVRVNESLLDEPQIQWLFRRPETETEKTFKQLRKATAWNICSGHGRVGRSL